MVASCHGRLSRIEHSPQKMRTASPRRLLLVGLDWIRHKDPPLSLASASIAAACADIADVNTITVNVNQPMMDLTQTLAQELSTMTSTDKQPPLVAVGGYVWAEHLLNDTMRHIKSILGKETQILLGGPQVSYAPAGDFLSAAYPVADGFVRGTGEEPMRRLLSGETRPEGYCHRDRFDTGRQASGGFATSPSPFLTGWMPPQRFLRWETKRGCPFSCSFCQHKDSQGRRTPLDRDRIFAECDWMVRQSIDGPLRDLAVVDPTFNSGSDYLGVLRNLSGFQGKISLQCRLEMMSDEFVDEVLELSRSADVVLEFGIQTIHRGEQVPIERPNNAKKIERWLARLNSDGVPYELSFIYGLPEQTLDSFRQTAEWAERKCTDHRMGQAVSRFFPLMLLRGTKLFSRATELGLVSSSDENLDLSHRVGSGIPHVVSSPTFTVDDWKFMNREAERINRTELKLPRW